MSEEMLRLWAQNIRLHRLAKDRRDTRPETQGMRSMAEALEVSVATVSRWETGKAVPTDTHKVEIAEYLEADVRLLFPLIRTALVR